MSKLTKKDFIANQEVRWCRGCGDYAILAAIQRLLPDLGIPKQKFVFISGIGCAGRLPYYLDTYGFHTIHGRAPAIATGLKLAQPDLSVWVITGDGDALSMGSNHLLHCLRRNVDINILLVNNRVYGLTKGQYSPTTELGKITKTSPYGVVDRPLEPLQIALAAGATFVARCLAVDTPDLINILHAAQQHKGTSIVEIYQNCNIFNDGTFDGFAAKANRAEHTINLLDNKPLRFGANAQKALQLNHQLTPEIVAYSDDNEQIWQHDVGSLAHAQLLANLQHPDFPVPLGIFRKVAFDSYEVLATKKVGAALNQTKLLQVLNSGNSWTQY